MARTASQSRSRSISTKGQTKIVRSKKITKAGDKNKAVHHDVKTKLPKSKVQVVKVKTSAKSPKSKPKKTVIIKLSKDDATKLLKKVKKVSAKKKLGDKMVKSNKKKGANLKNKAK